MGWASQVVLVVKNLPANAGDASLIFGSGRSPGAGNGNPLAWRIPTDRGAWRATVHRITNSLTRLKQLSMQSRVGRGQGGASVGTWDFNYYQRNLSKIALAPCHISPGSVCWCLAGARRPEAAFQTPLLSGSVKVLPARGCLVKLEG